MEKVKLPKEVAEAIKHYRSIGYMNRAILDVIEDVERAPSGHDLAKFVNETHDGFDALLEALVNGYEVEMTPEEYVKQYFNQLQKIEREQADDIDESFIAGEKSGIKYTLDLLGIKISGVNAE